MKSGVKPIKRRRLTDQIVDQLVSLIADGKLKKGDKLPVERELTEQFGVGRSSLREAIGALLLTGVLTT
ncbi:MAG: FadR family transcriptional regulator, partial [Dehalococcoidales bacterium]